MPLSVLKARPPKADAVVRRLLSARAQVVHGFATPLHDVLAEFHTRWSTDNGRGFLTDLRRRSAELQRVLEREGLWANMAVEERAFVASPLVELTGQQRVNASWLMERTACLLGHRPSLMSCPRTTRGPTLTC